MLALQCVSNSFMKNFKKPLILALKILCSAGALYLLFHQLDLPRMLNLFRSAQWAWVLVAFLVLNLAQLASALRMRFYFLAEKRDISMRYSIILYYVGMLFNLVLPGGIGGDGYKTVVLKRDFKIPIRTSVRLMISNRANGLLFLILIGLGFGLLSETLQALLPYTKLLLLLAAILALISYSQLAKLLLKEKFETQVQAGVYSFAVQALVAICAAALFQALDASYAWNAQGHAPDYLMLFMISSFVSVLPVSVGGIGLRELTFFYGTQFLGLNPEAGVAVALLYFAVNACASLIGLICFIGVKKHSR
jgi:uncharacterized membrane protein YbhN (UPF0104 family)